MKYYVRDLKGRIAGPFGVEAIKKAAGEGKILPSWHLSSTREKWTLAANVPGLFPDHGAASRAEPPADPRPNSTREGPLAVYLDLFKGGKDRFKATIPWIQRTRPWWVKLTRPSKGFFITKVGPQGFTRMHYDFASEQPVAVTEEGYEEAIKAGIRQLNWHSAFGLLVSLGMSIWALSDFGDLPDAAFGVAKLAAIPALLVPGYIYEARRTGISLGYVLAPEIEAKQEALKNALGPLSRCSRVWALRVKEANPHWRDSLSSRIGHLPGAIFRRALPNIRTNIIVRGVAFHRFALYFLPERLMVVDGDDIRFVEYGRLETGQGHMDHLYTGWKRYGDSLVVGHRWLHSRVNGQQDRRYKTNYQIPIIRLGILTLGVPGSSTALITTDPTAPESFRRDLPIF